MVDLGSNWNGVPKQKSENGMGLDIGEGSKIDRMLAALLNLVVQFLGYAILVIILTLSVVFVSVRFVRYAWDTPISEAISDIRNSGRTK